MGRRRKIRWVGAAVLVLAAVGAVVAVASRGGSGRRVHVVTAAERAALAAAAERDPERPLLRFAFVPNNDDDFWRLAVAGIRQFERESGATVDVRAPKRPGPQGQNELLATLAGEGYHGIAVSVIAPAEQAAAINAAAARTNVICVDSDAPGTRRLAYVGTNNYAAGRLLGDRIVGLLPAGGRVAAFVGSTGTQNARERLRGIEEATRGHGIGPIDVYEDGTDPAVARQNVVDAMAKHPDVRLLCGLWSYNGPAIADAIDAIDAGGLRGGVKAVAFDEAEGTLYGIDSKTIDCTVVQNPFDFGYKSSRLLYELATRGEAALRDPELIDPRTGVVDTGVRVVDKSNLGKFRDDLAGMRE